MMPGSVEIEKNMGTQFDADVAKCMLQIIDEDVDYKLHDCVRELLQNQETSLLIDQEDHFILRPGESIFSVSVCVDNPWNERVLSLTNARQTLIQGLLLIFHAKCVHPFQNVLKGRICAVYVEVEAFKQ